MKWGEKHFGRPGAACRRSPAILVVAMLLMTGAASAGTVTNGVCMQDLFGTAASRRLNCTANDIAIARATTVSPTECEQGKAFDLTATFEVSVNASERYDAGFYFRRDGGPDARGPGGECSLTTLDLPPQELEPWLDLDGDACGDFRGGTYEVTFTIEEVLCEGDGSSDCGGGECLRLPTCTSWHSNRGTACDEETDAIPETKSKCKCDDGFTVPVSVTPASATLTVNPIDALVTYEVEVENTGANPAELIDLCDDTYGAIVGPCDGLYDDANAYPDGDPGLVEDTDCVAGTIIATDEPYTCEFSVVVSAPGSASSATNSVSAKVVDTVNATEDFPEGSATVTVHLPQAVAP